MRETSSQNRDKAKLGELATIKYGKMLPIKELSESGFPVFGANGIIGFHNQYLYEEEQVLISCRGAYSGKINLSPPQCYVTNNSLILELPSNPIVTKRFLYYGLQSVDRSKMVTGSAQPQVTINNAEILELTVPPLEEQHQIVAEIEKQFTRLEEGVGALQRVQANLKRYRAAVLKAACEGKLVPTEAELRGKLETGNLKPEFESGEELLERILEERRKKWLESNRQSKTKNRKYREPAAPDTTNLPPLPEGWTWASVEQLGNVQLGRQRSPKNVSKNYPTKYIRAANITERGIDVSDVLEMEFSPEERERFTLRSGDIILSEASGSPSQVGKPAVWRDELPVCCFQNTVIRLRPSIVESKFVLVAFQQCYLNGVFAKVAGGVGINHLGAEKFSAIPFALPPLAEQVRIVEEVERRLSVVEEMEAVVSANLQRATRLRQSILQKAFEGKLV